MASERVPMAPYVSVVVRRWLMALEANQRADEDVANTMGEEENGEIVSGLAHRERLVRKDGRKAKVEWRE